MQYRRLGKTGYEVSAVSFGAWAIGGSWGSVDDEVSLRALHAAVDAGVNLIDTADVYGDGHSERLIARLLHERRGERIYVATKMGRRVEQLSANYTPEAFAGWLARSRENLGRGAHRPRPAALPAHGRLLPAGALRGPDELVADGVIAHYGVSVEKVEEALKAIEFPGVASVQIIFNMVRQRPADLLPRRGRTARRGRAGPGAAGLRPADRQAQPGRRRFAPDDHRDFNRHGESFDVGETFSGLDYETGLALVEAAPAAGPGGSHLAQLALRWILMFDGVTAAIPGAKSPEQAVANAAAADLAPLPAETMARVRELYEQYAKPLVHQRW